MFEHHIIYSVFLIVHSSMNDLVCGASIYCYRDKYSVLLVWWLKLNLWGTVARSGTGAKMSKRGYQLTSMGRADGSVK